MPDPVLGTGGTKQKQTVSAWKEVSLGGGGEIQSNNHNIMCYVCTRVTLLTQGPWETVAGECGISVEREESTMGKKEGQGRAC